MKTVPFYVLCLFILTASCTAPAKKPSQVPEEKKPQEIPAVQMTGDPEIDSGLELLAKNDFKGAIRRLEFIAQTKRPMPDNLKKAIVESHNRYIASLSTNRHAPLDLLNEVVYSHAMRILELEPDHAEAKAAMESVKMYFRNNNKIPPVVVDPLAFLDEKMAQAGLSESSSSSAAQPEGFEGKTEDESDKMGN